MIYTSYFEMFIVKYRKLNYLSISLFASPFLLLNFLMVNDKRVFIQAIVNILVFCLLKVDKFKVTLKQMIFVDGFLCHKRRKTEKTNTY
jgi:hypothetical protein